MKKRFYLSMAIVALSWMGCSQEEDAVNQMQMNGGKTINATIESITRSTVTDAGVFSWASGDAISVHDASSSDIYSYSGSGNGFTIVGEPDVETPAVAYYPANELHTTTAFYLPDVYGSEGAEYVASTNAAMIATPPTEGNTYAFMHLGGVMRFNVKNVPVDATEFVFTAKNKNIRGNFIIDETDGVKTIATTAGSNSTVTIKFPALTQKKDMTFYVPMPTGTYGDYIVGLKIYDGSLVEYTSEGVTNTINRKTLLLMPTFEYDAAGGELLKRGVSSDNAIDLSDGSAEAEIIGNAEVEVTPGDADATATLNYTPASDGSSEISISDGTGSSESTQSEGQVVVATSEDATIASCDINTPSLTVELSAAEGTSVTYDEVTALTAQQTLVIGEGVTINKLVVKGGNVVLKGNVKNIESDVETTITLDKNITLAESIVFSKGNVTVNLNGKSIRCASSDVFVVTDGTLTINGEGLVYGSEANEGNSCAVWVNGTNAKAIIKNGTYKVGGDINGTTDQRNDCIYVGTAGGTIEIYGGVFEYTGEVKDGSINDGSRFLVNQNNDHATQLITVYGGTFHNFDPANAKTDEPWMTDGVGSFVAPGYSSVAGENGTYVVMEGIFNETALKAAIVNGAEITLGADMTIAKAITIPTGITATINLNGFDVTAPRTDAFEVQGTLTIIGTEESVVSAGTDYPSGGVCAVWAHNGGNVTINGGYYKVYKDAEGKRNDCIYAGSNSKGTAGTIVINGGKFEYASERNTSSVDYNGDLFLLNCANSQPTSKITVNGGSFKNHVPSKESNGTENEVVLGGGKNVYNGETKVEAAHSGDTDIWYEVR